jgi:hypothetical protein
MFFGYVGLAEGIVTRFKEELGPRLVSSEPVSRLDRQWYEDHRCCTLADVEDPPDL